MRPVALERSHHGQSFHILKMPSWGKSPCCESGIWTLVGLENSRSEYRVSRLLRDRLKFKSRHYQVLGPEEERHPMGHKHSILLQMSQILKSPKGQCGIRKGAEKDHSSSEDSNSSLFLESQPGSHLLLEASLASSPISATKAESCVPCDSTMHSPTMELAPNCLMALTATAGSCLPGQMVLL